MPILKHNRGNYPEDWATLSYEIKDANGWVCQECGDKCRGPDDAYDHSLPELTISHYDNVYDAPEVFLACMCAKCHLLHDRPFRPHFRERNRRVIGRQAGQMPLFLQGNGPLSRAELAELEADWPSMEAMLDGGDIFRERYGEPTGGNV